MGKRSRKRPSGPVQTTAPERGAPAAPVRPPVRSTNRRAPGQSRIDRFIERADERPKPPWHPVPLVELCVFVGLVLLVLGALDLQSDRGKLLLVLGMGLGSLGGLDTALREHLAGYRSHTTVIAALPAVTAAAAAYFARVPWIVVVVAAVGVFAAVFWWMRRIFMRNASRARRARG
jgi:hypothetical protein